MTEGAQSTGKRVGGVLLVLLLLFVPEVVVAFTALQPDAALLVAGMLPALTAWTYSPRYALATIPTVALVNAVAALVFGNPVATTVFVAVLAVLVGLSAIRGLHPVAALIAVQPSITVVSGFHTVSFGAAVPGVVAQAVIGATVAAIGAAWAVLLGVLLLRDDISGPPDAVPPPIVVFYTGALVLLLTPMAFVASTWFLDTTAGWVLMTILLVTRPTYDETRSMILDRAVGTTIGCIIAASAAASTSNTGILIALGFAATLVAAVLQLLHARYIYFAVFVTVAIVLLNAERADVLETDLQRILYTIVGVLLVAGVVAVAEAVLGRHTPAEAGDPTSPTDPQD